MSDDGVLRITGLARAFVQGGRRLEVLRGLDLTIEVGEAVALMGPSGSGKSTLLHAAGLLEEPDAGDIMIAGQNCAAMNDGQRTAMRRDHVGFVYQFHHLLPEFDARENVAMPLLIGGLSRRESQQRAALMLERVGMQHRLEHRPSQLSGGERQRVAIARALVTEPACVLMDEPTGNLDPQSAAQVLDLIDELGELQSAFVVVTHDPAIAAHMHRTLELINGRLEQRP